ncbi:MAG: CDP-alcohol phosphatidyltransferase family protein [Gaiellales bacterium]
MEQHVPASVVRHVPNALTTLRLLAVPLFAGLMMSADGGESPAAAVVFAFAAVTDFLDGELSRRLHAQSRYGRVLDPIADRLLIDVAVVLLWLDGRVPLLLVLIVLARDVLLLSSLLFGKGRHLGIRVNVMGKAGTLVTMIGLLLAIVTPPGAVATQIVLWAGVVLLVLGGVVYTRMLRRLPD